MSILHVVDWTVHPREDRVVELKEAGLGNGSAVMSKVTVEEEEDDDDEDEEDDDEM